MKPKLFSVTLYRDLQGWYCSKQDDPTGSNILLCGKGLRRLFKFPSRVSEIELKFNLSPVTESVKVTIDHLDSGLGYAKCHTPGNGPEFVYLGIDQIKLFAGSDTWYMRLLY